MDFKDFRHQRRDARELVAPILVVGGILLATVVLWKCFYTVKPNEQAVVLRFGKEHAVAPPGLHFCIPFVDRVYKVSVEEHSLRLPFAEDPAPNRQGREVETLMLTGDLNAASVEWTIQWKVSNPRDFLFNVAYPEDEEYISQIIRTSAQTVMNRLIGDYSIDEVLTEKRTEIAEKSREATQEMLDEYQCGIAVIDLQLQRVTPPAKVKPAFDEVNSSIQLRDKLISEAKKEREKLLPEAEIRADQLVQEAEGYAKKRRAEVDGELTALRAKYEQYKLAPEVTRMRMYLEAMQEVLGQISSKTIIDGDLKGLLPLLQLSK